MSAPTVVPPVEPLCCYRTAAIGPARTTAYRGRTSSVRRALQAVFSPVPVTASSGSVPMSDWGQSRRNCPSSGPTGGFHYSPQSLTVVLRHGREIFWISCGQPLVPGSSLGRWPDRRCDKAGEKKSSPSLYTAPPKRPCRKSDILLFWWRSKKQRDLRTGLPLAPGSDDRVAIWSSSCQPDGSSIVTEANQAPPSPLVLDEKILPIIRRPPSSPF